MIARRFPDAAALYAARGWVLPERIDRVYDPGKAERLLGWRAQTDFGAVLAALRTGSRAAVRARPRLGLAGAAAIMLTPCGRQLAVP